MQLTRQKDYKALGHNEIQPTEGFPCAEKGVGNPKLTLPIPDFRETMLQSGQVTFELCLVSTAYGSHGEFHQPSPHLHQVRRCSVGQMTLDLQQIATPRVAHTGATGCGE